MSILKRKRFWGLLLTIGLLIYCFYDLDLYAILNAISAIDIRYLIPLIFIEVIIAFIRASRFTYFVDAFKPAKIRKIFPIYCIGIMTNLLMPYLTGQVARIFLLSKKAHVKKTSIFTTTVLEVLFDGLAIIAIFLVISLFEVIPDDFQAWHIPETSSENRRNKIFFSVGAGSFKELQAPIGSICFVCAMVGISGRHGLFAHSGIRI